MHAEPQKRLLAVTVFNCIIAEMQGAKCVNTVPHTVAMERASQLNPKNLIEAHARPRVMLQVHAYARTQTGLASSTFAHGMLVSSETRMF